MKAVSRVGAISGTVTRRRVVSVPAPDMVEASSNEASISRWAGSIRITMIGMVDRVMCTQVIPPNE